LRTASSARCADLALARGSREPKRRNASASGRYPWWSLAVFFLCVYIIHGIVIYGDDERVPGT
jgi:hypothetical protein